jgi:hypothetical protein
VPAEDAEVGRGVPAHGLRLRKPYIFSLVGLPTTTVGDSPSAASQIEGLRHDHRVRPSCGVCLLCTCASLPPARGPTRHEVATCTSRPSCWRTLLFPSFRPSVGWMVSPCLTSLLSLCSGPCGELVRVRARLQRAGREHRVRGAGGRIRLEHPGEERGPPCWARWLKPDSLTGSELSGA